MCGIAGFLCSSGLDRRAGTALDGMIERIKHRGPDGRGTWIDPEAGIALGHRRLSIIDPSAAGHQPMVSSGGRYVIIFNGEIYNFKGLRAELEQSGGAPEWCGHSDTEVLLAAICAWGVAESLSRAAGMFAFALWDRQERELTLARDRLGEKPLYYGWQGQGRDRHLLFGSDLASFGAHHAFRGEIDEASITLLLRYLYIPEPHSIYRGIAKLMPGTFVTIDAATGLEETSSYWSFLQAASEARKRPFEGTPGEAVDALGRTLGAAVERQMVSDVPIGAFLSGGVDFSSIVALMQACSSRRVKTFTIGFNEREYNEADNAKAVAAHLGTDHNELILRPEDALGVIPDLPGMFSEPFADLSQIPTFLLSRFARTQVTVSLSGDGGDELFGGYNRHVLAHTRWKAISRVPRPLRTALSRTITAVPPSVWDRLLSPLLRNRMRLIGDKIHKMAQVIASSTDDALYAQLISINPEAAGLTATAAEHDAFEGRDVELVNGWQPAERMMALDAVQYLPGDILVKVDRAAMAASLESRMPFLDLEIVRLAWSMPLNYKIRNGISKWPLRELLYRHVPPRLIDRPKMGFGIPIGQWLRGPLREWGEALLNQRLLAEGGLFDADAIRHLWHQHQRRMGNHEHRLWPVLMVQAWLLGERGISNRGIVG